MTIFGSIAAWADPCGMVPPIYDGPGLPITRVGEQQTYVYFKDGVESFVIHPGFSGKVDEFGMLIPFPTPPTLRKMPDHIFPHLAAAVDPPEVVINLAPVIIDRLFSRNVRFQNYSLAFQKDSLKKVKVLRQEAVGMYEVVVLEAGSSQALKRWMDAHGYRFPEGMEKVTQEYVEIGWCFVAVKAKVGQKNGVDPKPGQRTVNSKLPQNSSFDGRVQAMGFRFKTDKLVVPMRLSAFNNGKLRNIVYLLTDGPKKIRSIPEEYVVRQLPGSELFRHVSDPLPLRIISGTKADLQPHHLKGLAQRRDPHAKNGAAKELFAADLLATRSGRLSLPQEEDEKELLRIGEHFGLRGPQIDQLNAQALKIVTDQTVRKSLQDISRMTLTVVDGDFPRDVLAKQNLTFGTYAMPSRRNNSTSYDAKLKGPAPKKQGIVVIGALELKTKQANTIASKNNGAKRLVGWMSVILSLALVGVGMVFIKRRR